MLALTREKLLTHIQEIPHLIDMYQKRDVFFIEKTIEWLHDTENSLLQLRNPLVSFVASERGKIVAIHDGYIDPDVIKNYSSKRKARSATVVLTISHVENVLQNLISEIDKQFDIWREKLVQFIAVATTNGSIPLPPTEPREAWLKKVWGNFSITPETQGMYNYLNTAMSQPDRIYLLNELIENLLNGHSEGKQ